MPRLPVIDPSRAEGPVKDLLEGPLKGKTSNIIKGMANSASVLEFYLGMVRALAKSGLSPKEREAIQLAIGEANGCDYCTAAHTVIGRKQGLTEEQCLAARRGRVPDEPRLDAVVRLALAVHEKHGAVSAADLEQFLAAGFAPGHVAEVVATCAFASFTNAFNHLNETEIDFPAAPKL